MKLYPTLLVAALAVSTLPFLRGAETAPEVIPLWPNGAPGSEARKNEAEQARDYWVKNIHNPSITVFLPPKDKATGAAVVICPGGGHRELVFNAEGVMAAEYFNSIGVAAFALKYRLAREPGSTYDVERESPMDARRAMRLVRSRAKEWGVDPERLGLVGFSAGGEVVAMVTFRDEPKSAASRDAIDQFDAKPNFDIFIYPGPIGFPDVVKRDAPPAFFLAAVNDTNPANTIWEMIPKYRAAGVPVEAHLYSHGKHAFNMGDRSEFVSLRNWPQRVTEWMTDSGYLRRSSEAAPTAAPSANH